MQNAKSNSVLESMQLKCIWRLVDTPVHHLKNAAWLKTPHLKEIILVISPFLLNKNMNSFVFGPIFINRNKSKIPSKNSSGKDFLLFMFYLWTHSFIISRQIMLPKCYKPNACTL